MLIGYSYGSLVVADVADAIDEVAAFAMIAPPLGAATGCSFVGRGRETRRNEAHRCRCARRLDGLGHRVEYRKTVCILLATLAWSDAANDLRAVVQTAFRMNGAGRARNALTDDFG